MAMIPMFKYPVDEHLDACRQRECGGVTSVFLKEYHPLWVSQFEADRKLISCALGKRLRRIEHVGSTSIPGMKAKPIIDIALAVESLLEIDGGKIIKLQEIGYEYVPKSEFPKRMFFRRGLWGAGTHHLHVYTMDGDDWKKIILFRDYLRSHPDVAREYE